MNRIVATLILTMLLSATSVTRAGEVNWPQWRGPTFDGASKATNLPEKFSTTENVLWTTSLPGRSAATPVVWGDKVFVSSLDDKSKKILAMCIDRKDGHEIWRKEIGLGAKANDRNNMASPSPVTDGKNVWFFYGTGDLVCFDTDGKQIWARNLVNENGTFNFMWIYGSSATLYKGKLYVQVLHNNKPYGGGGGGEGRGPIASYLLAIDPATGKDLWTHVRPNQAETESKESYASPIPFLSSERGEIVLVGGDVVTGHDPETGKELWRAGKWNPGKEQFWRMIPSVVTGDGVCFACAPKGGPVMAFKGGGEGNVTETHTLWTTKEFSSDVCVPLYTGGKLYVLDGDRKVIYRVEPKTGKIEAKQELGGNHVYRASPTGADGKIYCINEGGQIVVLSMPDLKVLSKTSLGGEPHSRGSIAVVDGNVFVRTADKLFCFGKK